MANPFEERAMNMNRRSFINKSALGLGGIALSTLTGMTFFRKNDKGIVLPETFNGSKGVLDGLHHAAKAKRIIYLFQSGGPSQLELFDYKPLLDKRRGEDLPESIRDGQRLTGMTSGQDSFPLVGSGLFNFKQHGDSGAWMSDLLPYTSKIVDELCIVKSMHTEAINHDPAITFFQTGSQQPGRPSMGSWLSYGLGSDNENLPSFSVLLSRGSGRPAGQPLYSRLWGNGFLNSLHQGVQFRSAKDPVLYLNDPDGISKMSKRNMLDKLAELNSMHEDEYGDPEIKSRIAQYEMSYRMQTSVPDVMSIEDEPEHIYKMYGADSMKPGTFAANCLLARRLAEKGVKFIQLYHMGWDQHENLPAAIKKQAKDVDQASAALVMDLKQRGMLEDTLVIWGGEFGRTNYSQGILTDIDYGRDHHPRCFSMWMAGGGIKPGLVYGETDDFGYNIVKDPVHVHDFHATVLHQLGIDHEKFTYKYQGRRFRLTDVHGEVIKDLIA